MTSDVTIAALAKAWPSLAEAGGADWPNLYWQLLDCLRDYLAAADDEARARLADHALQVLQQAPEAARQIVRAEMRRLQTELAAGQHRGARGDEPPEVAPAGDLLTHAQQIAAPSAVSRYTDVLAPSRVQVGRRFAVIVGLTRSPGDEAHDAQELQAELNKLIKVVLTPRAPLEALNEAEQTLRVEADRDSAPVVFYLRAREAGAHGVLLDIYDSQTLLVSRTLSVEAATGPVSETLEKPAGAPVRIGDYLAPHPDLLLRVSTAGGQPTYHLHFNDTRFLTITGEPWRADPRTFRYNVMKEIEDLRRGRDVEGESVSAEAIRAGLVRIGRRLYRELFPEALRREYCRFREQVRTLQLISDEPWIPWELLKPYELKDFAGQDFEDDFLCARFDFSRWVMPGAAPAAEIAVGSLACLVPRDSGLKAAQAERAFLQALTQSCGLTDLSPATPDRQSVLSLLEGADPVAVWHFACHGDYREDEADNSPLRLADHSVLHPKDLVGLEVERRLSGDRPLVFLNACRAGSLGLSLTGLGGWAKRLVGDCRVGALIAPLWEVTDAPAQHLAEAFYAQTRQPGCTLAQAMRQARALTREAYPHDPTWLAYSLYAHPNARLRWT
jgi:hypothetical protein